MSGSWSAMNRVVRTRAGQILLLALGLTMLGAVFSLDMVSDMGWVKALEQGLSQFWAWGLLVPLIVAIDRRLPFGAKQIGRRMGAHLAACLVVTALYMYVFFALQAAFGVEKLDRTAAQPDVQHGAAGVVLWSLIFYWTIVGGVQAFQYYQQYLRSELRLERMERSLAEARLNALRMQLDPHFLFNALNTISSHVERNPKLTRRMIEHLGDLMRMWLECKDRQEVPFSRRDGVSGALRWRSSASASGTTFSVRLEIDPAVRFASVPSLLLQPLVENAIRHGISRRGTGGTVTVTARGHDNRLSIRVLDDGVGLPDGWSLETSDGLGLSVTRERIAGLYPNGESSFAVRPREGGGTAVEIELPLRIAGEEVTEHAAD